MEHITDGFPEVSIDYMQPTEFFDFDDASVRSFASQAVEEAPSVKEKAIKLFYAVRDTIRYDPYSISLEPEPYKASSVLAAGRGYCLPKANLLIACARSVGIPAGIGLDAVLTPYASPSPRRRALLQVQSRASETNPAATGLYSIYERTASRCFSSRMKRS